MLKVWKTKGTEKNILYASCRLADTLPEKLKGLMFSREMKPILFDFGAEAVERNSIHSCFCPRFDAVFMDAGKQVVDMVEDIAPFRFITPKRAARYLLEIPAGDAKRKRIKLNAFLGWSHVGMEDKTCFARPARKTMRRWANVGMGDATGRRVQNRSKHRVKHGRKRNTG